ncbi:hypothetical protein PRK78_004651 [Emydomyces testavorans]|uniref:Uncharacterized protein n=1 Tax=Emydomyces testavorans TaxID=2070801 RepID=A0AAF0DKA3_9EURO|nr:hypothetical protein PRK78_004651 [Emydomyces testavorans]
MTNSLEAKIVVLGAQGVGKTSLVQRYVKNSFNPSTTVSTVGASFVTKRVLDSTSDTIVRLQIWDTAGQERFRSISRLYYRGANAGLLCYDITDEDSFREMTGWLGELKQNLGEDNPIIIHVVGTKSDVVADDPSKRKVPFEKTIAYVAEQLYPTQASTPPPSSGMGMMLASSSSAAAMASNMHGPESKRSSGFWGQEIGWDCCHEISAKDGEGIEEVFRVITRKLVEQKLKKAEAETMQRGHVRGRERPSTAADGMAADHNADKRRSWLGFPPALALHDERAADEPDGVVKRKQGKCC